jgi:hypothetical protein
MKSRGLHRRSARVHGKAPCRAGKIAGCESHTRPGDAARGCRGGG